MNTDRSTLDMSDLDDFAPRSKAQGAASEPADVKKAVDRVSTFPSREAAELVQINIQAPRHIAERFKAMAKDDRRSYYAMLEILMNKFESEG